MPGSQPGQSGNIEHPDKCDNCHGGYNPDTEPAFNWRGSMMAQAARDPLFYACLAIANQDAPESGDLCIRCHSPDGWLMGRSVPTDGSALNNNDREGVQCDFCHKTVKPTALGVNPYPGDQFYTGNTYPDDQNYLATLSTIPPTSANGMYIADSDNAKRGPFVDAAARHQMYYSPFHKEAALCGTCHDVSNPAFSKQPDGEYMPNDFDTPAPDFNPYELFPIERTYSEWFNSEYNTPSGVYAPQFGGNKQYVSTCQDCHMRDVSGFGCNKKGAPQRDDLPLHDMTGGNTFIPELVKTLYPDEIDQAALDAGVQRAHDMLTRATSMLLTVDEPVPGEGYLASVRIYNETGHKLPSGYPEGRRIWLNVVAYDAGGTPIQEYGAYNAATGELSHDTKIYEIKPGLSDALASILQLDPGPSFHFAVNNKIFSDNRIPPRGFTNANFEMIQSPPINYSYADGQYWDDTEFSIPAAATQVVATLNYQTTTREYVEFLRDENQTNDWGNVLYDLWVANGKAAPVAMNSASFNIGGGQTPIADFIGDPTSGTAPLTVTFTDLSTNEPTSWNWDFGDGNISSLQNPTNSYESAGVFTVTLTVANAFGSDSRTENGYVVVTDAGGVFVHVSDITVTRQIDARNRTYGIATLTVVDQNNNPVSGATVTGDFSGASGGTRSGAADANGIVALESRAVKNPKGEWCFEVTNVAKTGATYDPAANIVTQACESSPLASAYGDDSHGRVLVAQNYPNPFNPTTDIDLYLFEVSHVTLDIYNVLGQKVTSLVDAQLGTGHHTFVWDGSDVASGIYLYRVRVGDIVQTKKMILQK
jgi:PKD repeat protein